MTPKSLLRLPAATSPVSEFTKGHFAEVLDDATANPDQVTRVLLCSGKVYYDLAKRRDDLKTQTVAVVRLEKFYPWPAGQPAAGVGRHPRRPGGGGGRAEGPKRGGW